MNSVHLVISSFSTLFNQLSPSSAAQRVLHLQGTSIVDISGYTGPIKKIPALLGPHQPGPPVGRHFLKLSQILKVSANKFLFVETSL